MGDGAQVLTKQRLQDLVKEVDPNEQLDDDVEELLLQVADDFIENVVTTSCLLAKHRKSSVLETKDVQLSLEKNWNMWIPGFGAEELQPYKKASSTEAHKQVQKACLHCSSAQVLLLLAPLLFFDTAKLAHLYFVQAQKRAGLAHFGFHLDSAKQAR